MDTEVGAGVSLTPVEDDNQKSGTGLKIATAISCVVAVCGIGFGVYELIQSLQKDNQISDLKAQTESNNATTPENTLVTNDVTCDETAAVVPNLGFKSNNFIGNVTYTIGGYPGGEQEMKAAFTIASPYDVDYGLYTVDADGTVKAQKRSREQQLEEKDITSNFSNRVIDLAIGQIGNGGSSWIIALLDDGTVETLSEGTYGKETFFEKASPVYDAKNITKIYGNTIDPIGALGYVQDKDGKIHTIKLNDASAEEWTFKVAD